MKNPFPLPKGLTQPEQDLVAKVKAGEWCRLGTERPGKDERKDAQNVIRASVIMHLAHGGDPDDPVHPKGVQLLGAWITGKLDFDSCTLTCPLWLQDCHVEVEPDFLYAQAQIISFAGAWVPGFSADGLTTAGGVFLRNGFEAQSAVRLVGARIGGDLDCTRGRFLGRDASGNALHADRVTTRGNVFLSHGFEARGAVRLLGAKIGGDLACTGGKFLGIDENGDALLAHGLTTAGNVFLRQGFEAQGAVRLLGAKIGGNFECTGGRFWGKPLALNLQKCFVTGVFFWKPAQGHRPRGHVDLRSAEVGDLSDDIESWPKGKLILDGFRCARISDAATSYAAREDWLERQRPVDLTHEFKPQPFEQLAKVLREMGHTEDAKRVAMLKQAKQRDANLAQMQRAIADTLEERRIAIDVDEIERLDRELRWRDLRRLRAHARWAAWWLFGLLVGYGYRPIYAFGWLALFLLVGSGIFAGTYQAGAMVPSSPVIVTSPAWLECRNRAANPAECWMTEVTAGATGGGRLVRGRDYPRFSAVWYAVDSFVPFVDLHQESHWLPDSASGTAFGWWARLYLYIHIGFGWIITALAAASVTNLVKKDV